MLALFAGVVAVRPSRMADESTGLRWDAEDEPAALPEAV
jgi:hypothetical protein